MSSPRRQLRSLVFGLVGLVLFFAVMGPIIYSFLESRITANPPVFETYSSGKTETAIKELDRYIYDTLLTLKIPAQNITFNSVRKKGGIVDQWTYSELKIHTPKPITQKKIKRVFAEHLKKFKPKPSFRFRWESNKRNTVDISINGNLTHRLIFAPPEKKKDFTPKTADFPLVAIIIDDVGYDEKMALRFLQLDAALSFSVLPHSPFQKSIGNRIHQKNRDVILHLPMEPVGYPGIDPGKGALLSSMSANELLLKKRGLFFVDSLTTPKSSCSRVAELFKLRFAERQVFLDNVQEANAIHFQIMRLISIAKERGKAIGIGHPYTITLETLKRELPNIKSQVKIVPVSRLVG
ncbi:MAG: divergent polysaccharide deacetylase family protein [Deltaproteobacteria bacterium]|nr:divergent polysaccharide deacetylase family protein [Deltaproteobacteria bacterium]